MRKIYILLFVLILLGCADNLSVNAVADLLDIAMNPAKFDGRGVEVSGVMAFNSAGVFLYPSCASIQNGEYRKTLLIDRRSMKNVKDVSAYWELGNNYNLKVVKLSGIVNASSVLPDPTKQVGGWVRLMDVDMMSMAIERGSNGKELNCDAPEK